MTDVEKAEAVLAAEAAILGALREQDAFKPSDLIERVSKASESFTRTEIVEAVWRLREAGKLEIDNGLVRELVAA